MDDVERWWEKVKDNMYWSGAIVETPWEQLWDDAKEELREIYDEANQ